MRSNSLLGLMVFLILGALAIEAAVVVPVKGQGPVKDQGPVKSQDLAKGQDNLKGQVLVKGQDAVKGQVPVKSQEPVTGSKDQVFQKTGTCPETLTRCTMINPPNRCWSDLDCPGAKKCCVSSCGMACLNPK